MRLYQDQPSGIVDRARDLRRCAPEPERRLLRALREAHPHLKWRHQVPVGPYYGDILCFSEKLVIEVDGDTHADMGGHDAARTRAIAAQGFRVLRVANTDVAHNLEGVLTQISVSLGQREGERKDEGEMPKEKGAAA